MSASTGDDIAASPPPESSAVLATPPEQRLSLISSDREVARMQRRLALSVPGLGGASTAASSVIAGLLPEESAVPRSEMLASGVASLDGGRDATPVIIYFSPDMETVARELARGPAASFVRLGRVEWRRFSDSWPNLFIHDVKACRGSAVMFLASFHTQDSLMSQLHVIYTLSSFAKTLAIIVPWYPTGTMERVTVIGEVATAKTVARMLSATPMCASGPPSFSILDIHALSEQFYFSDSVHVRLKSCIPLLLEKLLHLDDAANVRIAFPDDGARKRFGEKFSAYGEPIVCSKRREGDKRKVVVSDGDPTGRHCVIVDDLVQTGGTLLDCARVRMFALTGYPHFIPSCTQHLPAVNLPYSAETRALSDCRVDRSRYSSRVLPRQHAPSQALLALGASAVSAYVTHAVFPDDSWKKFAHEHAVPVSIGLGADAGAAVVASGGGAPAAGAAVGVPPAGCSAEAAPVAVRLRHFWVTNSLPGTAVLRGVAPFTVLSIAPIIEDIILFGGV